MVTRGRNTDNTLSALLITCGTMDKKVLQGEFIKIPQDKLPEAPGPVPFSRIFVSYSEAVLWSFPLHECTTWFVRVTVSVGQI